MQDQESILSLSGENVIEYVRDYRNELIDKLIKDEPLKVYLSEAYNVKGISNIKIEFIRRSLIELRNSSLDLSHYAQVILEMRKKGSIVVSSTNEKLFHADIEKSIRNYIF